VVCDDPRTDQAARSILRERLGIVNGAISGLAGPGERTAIEEWCKENDVPFVDDVTA